MERFDLLTNYAQQYREGRSQAEQFTETGDAFNSNSRTSSSGWYERRPIIGANCPRHRNYYTMTTAQQAATLEVAGKNDGRADGMLPESILPSNKPTFGSLQVGYSGMPIASTSVLVSPVDEEEGYNCSPCFDNDRFRHTFRTVVLGQILSICLCATGVSSQLLSNHGVNTPTAQSFVNYFFLCCVYGTILVFRTGEDAFLPVLKKRGWKYFLLSFVDVEANFMFVYAYQYTSLTSIQLLDCSIIPMVLLLSWFFLSVRYLITHIIGVCMCLIGIAVLIWSDVLEGKAFQGGSNRLVGDILCLGGSLMYAIGNVGEESLVKHTSRTEYLGMIGIFGSIISGIQLASFEHRQLSMLNWSGAIVGMYLLFAVSMFLFYAMVAYVMQKTSALMFNLSILTADFYTLMFGIFFFKEKFHYFYFISFIIITLGSVIYAFHDTERLEPNEQRKLCPCCFMCCCCLGNDEDSSAQGSINMSQISSVAPTTGVTSLCNSSPTIITQCPSGCENPSTIIPQYPTTSSNMRYCPVHGFRPLTIPTHSPRTLDISRC